MSCHSGQNEKLANSFIGKGATAVVGFTQTVYTAYCTNIGVYTLAYMTQINANTNNYYTLSQALDRAKAEGVIMTVNMHVNILKRSKKSNFQKRNLSFWVEIVPMITV